ncbi:hypothetical protein [Mitsuaria sp. 7]|uniref:hypothetical protein n=1 Tax=Mitsuaria sp. 7 TaxID=1658665 RepID=UPI0007DDD515|nr:hypothetical protein [Mitsuaria sp. 7]ANH66810.1 hypothetical protein ABE85_03130 [Mitsuaria sp. 7]
MTSIVQSTSRTSRSFNRPVDRGADAHDQVEARRLHEQLGGETSTLPRCPLAPAGLRAPAHLNEETLLGDGLPHASRLRDGPVLMASPTVQEALSFAHACVKHQIGWVVDLRPSQDTPSAPASPLDGGDSPFVSEEGVARFARKGRETPLGVGGRGTPEDHVRKIELSLKPGRNTPAADGHEPRDVSHALDWIRVPVDDGQPIPPKRLFDTSMHLARTASPEQVAFQCAQGQHTGATFAAAHALLVAHRGLAIPAGDLEEVVLDQCISIRRDRGPELFRPEDLASLMAFGRLMLQARDLP